MDKYIGILRKLVIMAVAFGGWLQGDLEDSAQELHALRYDIASELYTEFMAQYFAEVRGNADFRDWLSDQGETITIGREDK